MDISNTQALNIEDAIMLMQKEIAAHELELKKRQLEFALRLKLNKQGKLISDENIVLVANAIRTIAEIQYLSFM